MGKIDSTQITTIIPTYKRPERLKKAICSVLSQTKQSLKVCIYDNASDDSTAEVVRDLAARDHRVRYHCHSENIGSPANFQYGLLQVDTPYFSFLSDDDFLLPEFYETSLEAFEKYPDIAMAAGSVIDVEDNGDIRRVSLLWPDKEYFLAPEGLFKIIGKGICWTGCLFRTEAVRKVGLLDPASIGIDMDFVYRVAAQFPIVLSKKPVAVYVVHSLACSLNTAIDLAVPGWLKIISNLKEIPQLSLLDKTKAENILIEELKQGLFRFTINLIEQEKYSEAMKSARFYIQYCNEGYKWAVLALVLHGCMTYKYVHGFCKILLVVRRYLLRKFTVRNKISRRYKKLIAQYF
jgi:glycosyltransferase involved in cell wall biosynthesis